MQPNENGEFTLNTREIDDKHGNKYTVIDEFEGIELAVLESLRNNLVETMLECNCPIPTKI